MAIYDVTLLGFVDERRNEREIYRFVVSVQANTSTEAINLARAYAWDHIDPRCAEYIGNVERTDR